MAGRAGSPLPAADRTQPTAARSATPYPNGPRIQSRTKKDQPDETEYHTPGRELSAEIVPSMDGKKGARGVTNMWPETSGVIGLTAQRTLRHHPGSTKCMMFGNVGSFNCLVARAMMAGVFTGHLNCL